jgi:hypothetical protein
MRNAQPAKLVSTQYPSRPFDPLSKRSCLVKGLFPNVTQSTNASTLQQLILLQDWQRVLIRAKLFPAELQQYTKFQISTDQFVKVLPLHLVCALDPPHAVVKLLLDLYVDAAAMPIQPVPSSQRKKIQKKPKQQRHLGTFSKITLSGSGSHHRWNRSRSFGNRFQEWRKYRKGAFPVDDSCEEYLRRSTKSSAQRILDAAGR